MPDQFIELAERTGLVRPLTHWTLEEAADQQMRWSAQGVDLTIAVNISARALTPDLPGAVAALRDRRTRAPAWRSSRPRR